MSRGMIQGKLFFTIGFALIGNSVFKNDRFRTLSSKGRWWDVMGNDRGKTVFTIGSAKIGD